MEAATAKRIFVSVQKVSGDSLEFASEPVDEELGKIALIDGCDVPSVLAASSAI
ncbi:hypothetical protein CBOM_07062 [Ceraceosorus bombacis]|uniref:Uncharacterized protein n=1 Tax=Ceraceosorus bombacis TaxID=401625 RepID=A0A0P1A4W5_9BASI|nr:hypothetical protein CBOM_07062 [Ceraceosorus bombacis]